MMKSRALTYWRPRAADRIHKEDRRVLKHLCWKMFTLRLFYIVDNVFCIYGQWKGPEWTGGWKTTHNNPKFSFKNPENCENI